MGTGFPMWLEAFWAEARGLGVWQCLGLLRKPGCGEGLPGGVGKRRGGTMLCLGCTLPRKAPRMNGSM